jgi:hypothetical protein
MSGQSIEVRISNAGLPVLKHTDLKRIADLAWTVTAQQVEEAIRVTTRKAATPNASYCISILAGIARAQGPNQEKPFTTFQDKAILGMTGKQDERHMSLMELAEMDDDETEVDADA